MICKELFEAAAEIDETVAAPPECLAALSRRRVPAQVYDRDQLFKNMADGKISLISDYPTALKTIKPAELAAALRKYSTRKKYRVQAGRSKIYKYHNLKEIIDKWTSGRAIFSITDMHIRNTPIEDFINPKKLSTFNLYCDCDDPAASLEMMTMVISSRNSITDSHTDDSDGSNHCFVGKKLWLAWETHEGLRHGLEDVERIPVTDKARFDMKTFLSLKSARWFVVDDGLTLFLPGHLTHKVITLENYIGVGSFYLSFPNWLRTLSRWFIHAPNWQANESREVNQSLIPDLARAATSRYKRNMRQNTAAADPWGTRYLPYSVAAWKRQYPKRIQDHLLRDPLFQCCYQVAINRL